MKHNTVICLLALYVAAGSISPVIAGVDPHNQSTQSVELNFVAEDRIEHTLTAASAAFPATVQDGTVLAYGKISTGSKTDRAFAMKPGKGMVVDGRTDPGDQTQTKPFSVNQLVLYAQSTGAYLTPDSLYQESWYFFADTPGSLTPSKQAEAEYTIRAYGTQTPSPGTYTVTIDAAIWLE